MQKSAVILAVMALSSLGWSNAVQAENENACEIAKKACEDSRTGPHFQFVGVMPQANSVAPEWTVTVELGKITLTSPFHHSECTWEPALPDKIYPEGFNVNIKVSSRSLDEVNSAGATISFLQGFGPNAELGRNVLDVRAAPGKEATDQSTLHVNPHLPNDFAKYGDRFNIDVRGCDAGTMTYVYEYRE